MAAAAGPHYTRLGAGSYGVVFAPAFPNVNAAGNPVEFPGNVTKAFFDKATYEKALQNANILAKKIPSLHIPYGAYTRKARLGNLPAKIVQSTNLEGEPDETPLYMIRMPNLGVSFHTIVNTPPLLEELARVPHEVMFRELYKLMTIVQAIGAAGYVHADIREPNILVNTATGTMTLIDFDLLGPMNEFTASFQAPFYHIPPEATILLESFTDIFIGNLMEGITYGSYLNNTLFVSGPKLGSGDFLNIYPRDFMRDMLAYTKRIGNTIKAINTKHTYYDTSASYKDVLDKIKAYEESYEKLKSDAEFDHLIKESRKRFAETADSFSLAYCFTYLMKKMPSQELKELAKQDFIKNMMCGDVEKRIDITTAMEAFRAYAGTKGIELHAPTPAAAVKVVKAEVERMAAMAAMGAVPAAVRRRTIGSLRAEKRAEKAAAAAATAPATRKRTIGSLRAEKRAEKAAASAAAAAGSATNRTRKEKKSP
jgi:serine/threonine protein kinase